MRLGTGFQALASVSVAALLTGGAWAQQPSITWLGTLPNGARSYAQGVSADGAVVAGYDEAVIDDEGVGGELRALRWTRTGGTTPLATRGANSQSLAVSADGSILVGWTEDTTGMWRAAKWGADGSLTVLGTLGGNESAAYGVSADGAVIVGWAEDATNRRAAVRWQADGTVDDLGVPTGFTMSWATGASAEGDVIAAVAYADRFRWRAFRWRSSGWESLPMLDGYENSLAAAVAANGAVIVGRAFNGLGVEDSVAVYWTPDGAAESLGTFGGSWSAAYGVSANGAIIVGAAEDSARRLRAFRWAAGVGMEDLNRVYARLLGDGSLLEAAYGVSPDGRYIVGVGYNAATNRFEGFLLDTVPEPASLLALSVGLVGLRRIGRRQ
jgi:probable HAF family extracellular repeat protein